MPSPHQIGDIHFCTLRSSAHGSRLAECAEAERCARPWSKQLPEHDDSNYGMAVVFLQMDAKKRIEHVPVDGV